MYLHAHMQLCLTAMKRGRKQALVAGILVLTRCQIVTFFVLKFVRQATDVSGALILIPLIAEE
jgi:hypothetical protein